MKTLRVLTLLLLPFVALAQNAPFPPASTSDVIAGTERNKFVSPYTLTQAGFSSPTGGITAAVATNIAAYQAQIATNGLTSGGGNIASQFGNGTNTALFEARKLATTNSGYADPYRGTDISNGVYKVSAYNTTTAGGHTVVAPPYPGISFRRQDNDAEVGAILMWDDHAGVFTPEMLIQSDFNVAILPGLAAEGANLQLGNNGKSGNFANMGYGYPGDNNGLTAVTQPGFAHSQRLIFPAVTAGSTYSYPGIMGFNAGSNAVYAGYGLGELGFYTALGVWNVGGAGTRFTNAPGILVMRMKTNGLEVIGSDGFIGNGRYLTNASPDIATNNASATDGMALVKRGNNLNLETIIPIGALFTNAVNRIADETIFLKDSSGNSLMSWDSDNTDLRLFANVVAAAGGFVGHGGSITNLNASNLTSGTVNLAVTNSAVKTGDLVVTNNATVSGNLSVAGTFNVGTANVTNLTSTATGNTNRIPVWGPSGNLTNVSLVNLTLDTGVFPATLTASSGGSGDMTNNSTLGWTNKANIVITNTAVANTKLYLDGSRTTSGNVIQYSSNNVSKFSVDTDGSVTAAGSIISSSTVRAANNFGFSIGSGFPTIFASSADEANIKRNSTANNYANLSVSNVVSSGFSRATNGYWMPSNSLAIWPASPLNPGDAYWGNSNGTIYLLQSGMGATWTSTNKIGQ